MTSEKIIKELISSGLVKEEKTNKESGAKNNSLKAISIEEKQLKKAIEEVVVFKKKIEKGGLKGTDNIEKLLDEIL